MKRAAVSPRITHLSWGRLEVEGREAAFKDAKLFPGGARTWDWNETGTRHMPGIQPADVEVAIYDVLGRRVATLVDDRRSAGSHVAEVDAANWAAGVYVCRLSAGGRTVTRTMMLVR